VRLDRPRVVVGLRGLPQTRQHPDLEGVERRRDKAEGEGEQEQEGAEARVRGGKGGERGGGHGAARGDATASEGALVGAARACLGLLICTDCANQLTDGKDVSRCGIKNI